MSTIVDFGSRSIKVFSTELSTSGLQVESINWRPLEKGTGGREIEVALDELRDRVASLPGPVLAVGTAFARRSPALRRRIEEFCAACGWPYETLSQERELSLVARAFAGSATGRDIFNVGGGSIQIAAATGSHTMLDFGISDLNARFDLDGPVPHRRVAACVAWLEERLPRSTRPFVYTGGEATYLAALGLSLGPEGRCEGAAFRAAAMRVAQADRDALERLSPFGPGWMTGAVASNCVVLAALRMRELDHFFASDRNVADGLALAYREESRAR